MKAQGLDDFFYSHDFKTDDADNCFPCSDDLSDLRITDAAAKEGEFAMVGDLGDWRTYIMKTISKIRTWTVAYHNTENDEEEMKYSEAQKTYDAAKTEMDGLDAKYRAVIFAIYELKGDDGKTELERDEIVATNFDTESVGGWSVRFLLESVFYLAERKEADVKA